MTAVDSSSCQQESYRVPTHSLLIAAQGGHWLFIGYWIFATMNSVKNIIAQKFDSLSFQDKLMIKQLGRQTPDLKIVQKTKKCKRFFNKAVYQDYQWLTGCPDADKLYCFPCLLFCRDKSRWSSVEGVGDLHNLVALAKKHEHSSFHKFSYLRLQRMGHDRIDVSLSLAHAEVIRRHNTEVDKNRAILKRLIACALFLAQDELAFRGHDESKANSGSRGKFKDLCSLLAKFDPTMKEHLETATVFRGDSKTIQDDLTACIAECVREQIREDLSTAPFVAVMADETTDVSCQSQCCIIFRYLRGSTVCERFWSFQEMSGKQTSQHLADLILGVLRDLNINNLVAQTYDGCSTMSGAVSGVQKRVREAYPLAQFIHCHAHKLNLVIQNSLQAVSQIRIFLQTLNGLHAFFRSPKRRAAFQAYCSKSAAIKVCETRWTFKARAVSAVYKSYKSLTEFFEDLINDENLHKSLWDVATIREATGFLSILSKFDFVFFLCFMHKTLGAAEILFKKLQAVRENASSCKRHVENFKEIICKLRTNENFETTMLEARTLWNKTETFEPVVKRRRTDLEDKATSLRRTYYEVCDHVVSNVEMRFDSYPCFVALVDETSFEKYESSFPLSLLRNLTESSYGHLFTEEELKSELELLYSDKSLRQPPDELLATIDEGHLLPAFPELHRFLQLILTFPMTTTSAERSFSCLKRLKTYLRNCMRQDRLSNLAVLSLEGDIARQIPDAKIIEKFANKSNRRIILHYR